MAGDSLRKQFKVLDQGVKEWEKINRDSLRRAIKSLYKSKMIAFKDLGDGRVKMVLLDSGKEKVLEFNIDNIQLPKPGRWDGKWRMVVFDIPTNKKKSREAFRFHLRRLGFYKFQKSVFIYPFKCDEEIQFLIEFYKLRPYVRTILVLEVDNALDLKEIFDLS